MRNFNNVLLCFLLLLAATKLNAQNKSLSWSTSATVLSNAAIDKEFYQVQYLQLNAIDAINPNDILNVEIDGQNVLTAKVVDNKIFSPNYIAELNTPNGMQTKTLKDLNFHGQYYSGVHPTTGLTLSSINIFDATYVITFLKNNKEYYIEPLSNFDPSASKMDYILYQISDIIPVQTECHEPANNPIKNPNAPLGIAASGTNCKVIDYAILCDYTMYTKYGNNINNVINRTVTVTNLVQTDYTTAKGVSDDMCFKIIEHYIPTCTSCNPWPSTVKIDDNLDSFTLSNKVTLLSQFDLASYYFNGVDTSSNTVGLAWVSTVCDLGYNKNALRDFTSNNANMRNMVSHEIGHNFSCRHDTIVASIMSPTVNGSSIWSAYSNGQMNNYIANFSPCLSPCPAITNQCDTLSVYGLAYTVNQNAGTVTATWALNNNSHNVYWYTLSNNTWTAGTLIPAGTTSATFTYPLSACADKIIFAIEPNCGSIQGGAKQIVLDFTKNVQPIVAIATVGPVTATNVSFNATPTTAGSNPTYVWYVNNVAVSTSGPNYSLANPIQGQQVYCIITSNNPCGIGNKDTSNVYTVPQVNFCVNYVPTVTITPNVTSICAGSPVTFNATFFSGGPNCTATNSFQWKINGVNVGTNSATFTTSALTAGAIVTCVYNPNSTFAVPATATSNAVTITVNPVLTPSVVITASTNTVCPGTIVTFTAVATNGGATPTFQWKRNGINVGTNSSTYTGSALANNDVITCVLTSNALCASPTTATSNGITIVDANLVTPSINIAASQNPFCPGTSVTFTATVINGGSNPTYQWFVNNAPVGTNASTFTSATLAAGNVVTCRLTSSTTCVVNNISNSNAITMSATAPLTPTVNISTPNTSICPTATITFTATTTNGGAAPMYQWKMNGNNVGTNANTYTASGIPNNAVITCVITSNANVCLSTTTATSNTITIQHLPQLTPTISISPSAASICQGANVTFFATITNGGNAPVYQWKANGTNVGTNAASFTSSSLPNNALITCNLVSSLTTCLSANNIVSNTATLTVNPIITPTIAITASANPACSSSVVTFNATTTNAGTTGTIQWSVNGNNVGTNSPTFSTPTLLNGSQVIARLLSSAPCITSSNVASNTITMQILPTVTPTATITPSKSFVCENDTISFSFAGSNLGTTPIYQWSVNGNAVGTNSPNYLASALINNDVVVCNVTSNAVCPLPATVSSNPITVNVISPVTPNAIITASDSDICINTVVNFTVGGNNIGNNPTVYWYWNGLLVDSGANFATPLLEDDDSVYCVVFADVPCYTTKVDTSNAIVMKVTDNLSPNISITQSINAGNPGTPITYTATTPVVPPYTIQWYKNGAFVANTSTNTWSTNIATTTDSVRATITNFSGCYTANLGYSNTVKLGRPENIASWSDAQINIFPNPTASNAFVEGVMIGDDILVYDITGKILQNVKADSDKFELNLSGLSAGFYQVKVMRNEQVYLTRLVKQ